VRKELQKLPEKSEFFAKGEHSKEKLGAKKLTNDKGQMLPGNTWDLKACEGAATGICFPCTEFKNSACSQWSRSPSSHMKQDGCQDVSRHLLLFVLVKFT